MNDFVGLIIDSNIKILYKFEVYDKYLPDNGKYYLFLFIKKDYFLELQKNKISSINNTSNYDIYSIDYNKIIFISYLYSNDIPKISKNYNYYDIKKKKYKRFLLSIPIHNPKNIYNIPMDNDTTIINTIKYTIQNYFNYPIKLYVYIDIRDNNSLRTVSNFGYSNFSSPKFITYSTLTNEYFDKTLSLSTSIYKGSCNILSPKSNIEYITYILRTSKYLVENIPNIDKSYLNSGLFTQISSLNDISINSNIFFDDIEKVFALRSYEGSFFYDKDTNKGSLIVRSEHSGNFYINNFTKTDENNINYFIKLNYIHTSPFSKYDSSETVLKSSLFNYHNHPGYTISIKSSYSIARAKQFPSFQDMIISLYGNFINRYILRTSISSFIISENGIFQYGFDIENNKSLNINDIYILKLFLSEIEKRNKDDFSLKFINDINSYYGSENPENLQEYIDFFNKIIRFVLINDKYIDNYYKYLSNDIIISKNKDEIKYTLYRIIYSINFINIKFLSWDNLLQKKHFTTRIPKFLCQEV